MRCDNCGWDNAAGIAFCIKCKTKLDTVAPSSPATKDNGFNKTVLDNHIITALEKKNEDEPELNDELVICTNPDCEYPNSPGVTVCSKCKQPIRQHSEPLQQAPETKNYAGTIDPYRKKADTPKCFFKLIPKEQEEIKTDEQVKGLVFENAPIILNRDVLDKHNKTITNNVQAELVYDNGKWFLSDRSEFNTTFIHVGEKMELKDGDLILVGDRKFIFLVE